MIGPPGLPKFGRRVFSFATSPARRRERRQAWKWLAGLYLAGVLAHFSHHMTFGLPASLDEALQIREVNPRIGPWLLPPCTLRHHAQVRPVCPEGDRFCGVVVWKQEVSEFVRSL